MLPRSGSTSTSSELFEATRWSVVLAAGRDNDAPELARAALAQLCQTYWVPLYSFIRRRGYPVHDAQDLTQQFFAHLIERQIYKRANPQRGKFRSFLLASLKNFLANAYDCQSTLKRGGACEFLPLHEGQTGAAEAMFQSSAASSPTSTEDRCFERQWAETLISTAIERLAAEFAAAGKSSLFDVLAVFLHGSADPLPTYEQLVEPLAMPVATIRSYVTRLRARYREVLHAELRRTVDTEEEVDEELRELLRVLTMR